MSHEPSAASMMQALSDHLGLNYEDQDWGIVNADASRLDEFIHAYNNLELASGQRFEMAELIVASANELLAVRPSADLSGFLDLLRRDKSVFRDHVDYWAGLSRDAFPISAVLRAIKDAGQ